MFTRFKKRSFRRQPNDFRAAKSRPVEQSRYMMSSFTPIQKSNSGDEDLNEVPQINHLLRTPLQQVLGHPTPPVLDYHNEFNMIQNPLNMQLTTDNLPRMMMEESFITGFEDKERPSDEEKGGKEDKKGRKDQGKGLKGNKGRRFMTSHNRTKEDAHLGRT